MSKRFSAFFHKLPGMIPWLGGLFFVYILCLLVLGEGAFSFAFNNQAIASNRVLFPIALALIALCLLCARLLGRRGSGKKAIHPVMALAAAHILLFLLQWIMVRSLWFYPAWDPLEVRLAAEEIARGVPFTRGEYYAFIPHNAALALIMSIPYQIGLVLGMAEPYIMLPIFGAAGINLSCFFATLSLGRLTGSRRAALFGFGLSTVFVLLSPYVSIAYSDSYAVLFPVLTLFLCLTRLRPALKWFLMTLVSAVGAVMKPTVLIFWIALVLCEGLRLCARLPWKGKDFKRMAAIGAVILLGFLPNLLLQNTAKTMLSGSPNPEGQLPLTHYLMMGFNPDTYGGNSPEDETFSRSFETLEERKKANVDKTWERLTAMSLPKAAQFFSVKMYKSYNSGTFAWNGSFLPMETPRRSDGLSVFLRSIYYNNGEYNSLFIGIYHTLWLGILTLCAFAFLGAGKSQPQLPVLALTLLGLSGYLMLFECWPRYLFLYAPFFVIVAGIGFWNLAKRFAPEKPKVR